MWHPTTRWVQAQQLLACGPSKTSQAVAAFRELHSLTAAAAVAFSDTSAAARRLTDALLAVSTSDSGLHRSVSRDVFARGCRAVSEAIGELVAPAGAAHVWKRPLWMPESGAVALEAFFAYASLQVMSVESARRCG